MSDDVKDYAVQLMIPDERVRVYVFDDYQTALARNPSIPRDLHFCDYCGGHTKDDARGHCAACGGPRKEYKWDR
jgi:rubrerythrin